jgi:AAA+ superfamily predicted ATPase
VLVRDAPPRSAIPELVEEPLPLLEGVPQTAVADAEVADDLAPALELLDGLLREALAEAERRFGAGAAADPYRGLYLMPGDVEHSLTWEPGRPMFAPAPADAAIALGTASPRLLKLTEELGLTAFDAALIAVAIAPELDLRYERIYAILQDDVTRRRPSLDLALNLLCSSAAEKVERRRHVVSDAPLVRSGVMELAGDQTRPDAPLLALELALAGPVCGFVLGAPGPDPRLAPLLLPPPSADAFATLPAPARARLARAVRRATASATPLRLYFRGAFGTGRHAAARLLARAAKTSLLALDLSRSDVDEHVVDRLLRHALLEARLRGWLVYLSGADAVPARWGEAAAGRLLDAVARHPGIVVLSGTAEWWAPDGDLRDVATVDFGAAPFRRRRAVWRRALAAAGVEIDPALEASLAERFELTPLQIASAVRVAANTEGRDPSRALFAAARAQAGRQLGEQARRVEPVFGFDDLVLPSDSKRQLLEICERVEHRRLVHEEWGFGARLPLGSGVNVLFSGPSGTGKTMAAQVVAGALGLDLYRIDLSCVVSKYIGETEKNLGRIFDQAEASNAILFFDEADALFGKRSEVKDAHDRYANIEIGYLLQKMEEYRGVTILATNLRQNMDEAFVRRLAFHVHFALPDERDRIRIWRGVLPQELPVADDVDVEFLGRRFKVSGGNIHNAALAGAFLAAGEGGPVAMRHLVLGMRREFQKMGKACVEADFEPYFQLLDGDVA